MEKDSEEMSKNKNICFIDLLVFWKFFLTLNFFPLLLLQYNLGIEF